MMAVVTEPGVYDLPNDEYQDDPVPGGSLSSTGAKRLLPPSCPARFRYLQTHRETKHEFDIGHAAHRLVLGAGEPLAVVEAADWRTKAAKEQRDAARADGRVPILAEEYARVQEMAAALREHPVAAALFHPKHGKPEQSLFWVDDESGIWRRARLDWLPNPGGRMIVADYKTCASAAPAAVRRAVEAYGYHQQAAWYLDGIAALKLADDAAFLFVFQETAPPHLVTVVELDFDALLVGRAKNRQAIDVYTQCVASGRWPGYGDDIELISLPPWADRPEREEVDW